MVSASEIVLEFVCPSLGLVMANLMFLAPLKDLQSAVTRGAGLGDLNPTPWAFMLGNCLGWSTYGVLLSNWFVFWANYPGFLISCWLNLGAVKLLYASHHQNEARRSLVEYLSSSAGMQRSSVDENNAVEKESFLTNDNDDEEEDPAKTDGTADTNGTSPSSTFTEHDVGMSANNPQQQDWAKIVWDVTSQNTPAQTPHERLVVGIVILWTLVLSAIGFYKHYALLNSNDEASIERTETVAQSVIGYVVNFNLLFFYGAPLSTIHTVLKTRRSDTLHVPTMVMNTFNAVFWTAYALAPQINDPFIYVPNGLGAIFGTLQFVLWTVFPKTLSVEKGAPQEGGSSRQDHPSQTTGGDGNIQTAGDAEAIAMVASA